MFACLSLCSYAQAPLSTEVVTGSFEALYKKTANLEIEYIKIHTVKVVVTTISPKGDYSFVVQLIDKKGEIVGSIAGLFGKGGMFGTKLNLIKDGAKSTGKKLGTILKKYI